MPCHTGRPCTISHRFRVCAISTTDSAESSTGISYATTCATDRIPPSTAYLLLDDQPAMKIAITVTPESTTTTTRPLGISANACASPSGTSDVRQMVGMKIRIGANRNVKRSVASGRHQLLGEQLEHVGDGLQRAVEADLHGSEAPLRVRRDLPLQPDQEQHVEGEEAEDGPGAEGQRGAEVADDPRQQVVQRAHHRSTSGITRSVLPSTATASATMWPGITSVSTARLG